MLSLSDERKNVKNLSKNFFRFIIETEEKKNNQNATTEAGVTNETTTAHG